MKTRATVISIMFLFVGCNSPLLFTCEDTIKDSAGSLDGAYIATVYERNCGATTDFSTVINLREESAKFDGEKDIVVVIEGSRQIALIWHDNSTLRVECATCSADEIFKHETSWREKIILFDLTKK